MAQTKAKVISGKRAVLAMATLASLQGAAYAGTATSTLTFNASVTAQCLIGNATLGFGTFGVLTGAATAPGYFTAAASGSIPVVCTNGWPATIFVATDNVTMTGSSATANILVATVWADAAYATAYPTSASAGVAFTGNGLAGTSPIYGHVVSTASTKADAYQGAATLTISY